MWADAESPHDERVDHREQVPISEQKVPGVVDAKLPPISEKTYAILIAVSVAAFAVAVLIVAYLSP